MSRLQLENVAFSYQDEPVLRDLNLTLEQGIFYGVVGPNGAGKSTMLKLLDRYLLPKEGSISLNGRSLASYSLRDLAKEVALVPQTLPYFPFTVREIVLLGRTPFYARLANPSPQDYSVCAEALRTLEIEHLAQRLVSDLSGGERQRVTLARAFAQQTEVLLLDEPTAHLDLEYQLKICRLLQQKSRLGMLIVAVQHDLNLATNYCDQLIVLAGGAVAAMGPPSQILTTRLIETTYNTTVSILHHPLTGRPVIVP